MLKLLGTVYLFVFIGLVFTNESETSKIEVSYESRSSLGD